MEATGSPRVGQAARFARHHWWLVTIAVAVGLAGGGALLSTIDRAYESTTTVLVEGGGAGRGRGEVDPDTEAQLVRSTANAIDAGRRLGSAEPPYRLVAALRVQPIANTSVLRIGYTAGSPRAAQAGSRAFAEAYLANRAEAARAGKEAELAAVHAKIAEASRELSEVNYRIGLGTGDPTRLADLRTRQANLTNEIAALTGRADELTTSPVGTGTVIGDAELPSRPVSPDPRTLFGTGAAIGLVLGLAAALIRDRLDGRVRDGVDVTRWTAAPVLAEPPVPGAIRSEAVASGQGPGGRPFNRLRNEVLASLRPEDRLILVTGVSPGPGAMIVSAHLAAALARAGSEVAVVGADGPDLDSGAVALSELLDVADVPGLTDVLAHRASLAHALQRAPRVPRLRVIAPGGTASAAGLLQADGVRTVLGALRYHARYVVVQAPSAASGADAQSLARLADVVILVAERGAAHRAQLVDAVEQVRRVGTRLLGAVVLPRSPVRDRPAGQPRPSGRVLAGRGRRPDRPASVDPSGTRRDSMVEAPTVVLDRIDDRSDPTTRADAATRDRPD